jgi:hypothetical protein
MVGGPPLVLNVLGFSRWRQPTAFAEAFRNLEAGTR